MSKEEEEKQLNLHVFHTSESAFNSRDIDKMVSLLTDNIKINSISFGEYKGKEGAIEYWHKLFDTFPDIELKIVTMTAEEKRIVTEISFSGSQKGQIYGSSQAWTKNSICTEHLSMSL